MLRLSLIALLTLSVLPAAAQQSGQQGHEQTGENSSTGCGASHTVVLESDVSIDVATCGSNPNISAKHDRVLADLGQPEYTPGSFPPPEKRYYTRTSYNIGGSQNGSSAYVFVYEPEGNWLIPSASLKAVGDGILATGDPLTAGDTTGWVVKQDSRLNQQGKDWLPARQIVEEKSNDKSTWVFFRIILDQRHNRFYYLYQRTQGGCGTTDANCALDQANRLFNSFKVDGDGDDDSRP